MLRKLRTSLQTIRVRIVAIVALCWLLPTLVLGVYMSGLFFDALREKTEQALVASASHAQEMTLQEIERILKKSKDVTYDEQLSGYAASYAAGAIRFEDFFVASRIYWQRMFLREPSMDFTAFFLTDAPDAPVYTAKDSGDVSVFLDKVQPQILVLGEALDTRSMFAVIDDKLYHVRNLLNRKMDRYGMLVLQIDPAQLLAPLLDETLLWQGQVDIVLDEYRITANEAYPFNAETWREGLYTYDGDLYYAGRVATSDYALTYRIRLDRSLVYGQLAEYSQIILTLILLLLPMEGLIMLFLHFYLTRPLVQLSKATTRLAAGELGVTVPAQGNDEIGHLGMAFNTMSLQMQRLIDKSYREELALRDARISALQSRINPHFINNALELMNWQARMEGAESVSQMIEAMSILLNAALDRSNERTVQLADEVEVADAYFFIIQQRFGGRIQIEKIIESRLLSVRVPRLIIQTLLENAVEHGISPAGGGRIRMAIFEQAGMLYIQVRNDGTPLSPQAQENIARLLSDTNREAQPEHLGIRNVNLRLKLIYHEAAGLDVTSEENGETLASIHIPMENPGTSDDNDDE